MHASFAALARLAHCSRPSALGAALTLVEPRTTSTGLRQVPPTSTDHPVPMPLTPTALSCGAVPTLLSRPRPHIAVTMRDHRAHHAAVPSPGRISQVVDLVLHDGECTYAAVTDNWPASRSFEAAQGKFNETGSNSPSVLSDAQQAELTGLAISTTRALGFRLGTPAGIEPTTAARLRRALRAAPA
eukprot:6432619-Prymnesium_polylepis.1